MKNLVLILTLMLNSVLFAQTKKDYVKFSEAPEKRIGYTSINEHNYFVEFKSHKKGSIFLELIKDETVIALSRISVKSKEYTLAKLNLNARPNKRVEPGSGYKLRLSLYASETQNYKKLLSEVIVDDVRLTRLLYSKL